MTKNYLYNGLYYATAASVFRALIRDGLAHYDRCSNGFYHYKGKRYKTLRELSEDNHIGIDYPSLRMRARELGIVRKAEPTQFYCVSISGKTVAYESKERAVREFLAASGRH